MTWLFDTVCVFSCLEHSSNLSWIFTTWLVCFTRNLELLIRSSFRREINHPNSSWMLITKQIPSCIFWRLDLLNPGNDPISSRTWVDLNTVYCSLIQGVMSFAKFYHSLIFQFPMYLEPLAPRHANISGKDQPLVPIFLGNWKMRDYRFPPKKTTRGTNMDLEETHFMNHFGAWVVQQVSGCFSVLSRFYLVQQLPKTSKILHDVHGNPRSHPPNAGATRPYLRPY